MMLVHFATHLNPGINLDFISTWLFKECSSVLVPTITNTVIVSLISGQFHPSVKEFVISLLKKPTLLKEELPNYRPISNLSPVSKIIERVVKSLVMDHLTSRPQNADLGKKWRKTETVCGFVCLRMQYRGTDALRL